VLEVGSGNGINLLSLAGAFPDTEFVGLELTQQGVEQSRRVQSDPALGEIVQRYTLLDVLDPSAMQRIEFIQGDASRMPFAAGSFDLVMTVLAVEQMEMIRAAALSEIARVSSGHVLMLEPFRDANEEGLKALYVRSRGYFRGSVAELRDVGIDPVWAPTDFPQETYLGSVLVLGKKQS
jgi:ubiquinone/menaquinone biosynthesis C-methylase UbiE